MVGVIRIRLDISYQGTAFSGWAAQPGLRTVEGVLADAVTTVLRVPAPRLTVAGRTDAGVHARGQVVHLDLAPDLWDRLAARGNRTSEQAFGSRLNGVLPADLVVRGVRVAADGFDARFSALHRRYNYRIADAAARWDPLRRDWTLWTRRDLDVAAMHNAAQRLVGVRDFAAYCRPRPGATTIRHLQEFSWERVPSGPDSGLVVATVQADAFCHNMVRALVGASIVVGEGRRPIEWPAQVLAKGVRDAAVGVVEARGLVLEDVTYPPESELAERAESARARRAAEHIWCDGEAQIR